jgi:hypothetical protein
MSTGQRDRAPERFTVEFIPLAEYGETLAGYLIKKAVLARVADTGGS